MLHIVRAYSRSPHPRWTIDSSLVARMIGLFLQQLNEKIDRIRLLAGSLLQEYFDNYWELFEIAERGALQGLFGQ
jgi:hypothetical protein